MKKPLLSLLIFWITTTALLAQGPNAFFTISIDSSCAPGYITVTNFSDTSGLTGFAQWEWNIAAVTYTDYEPVVPPLNAGDYEVRLTLKDDLGPRDVYTQNFSIYPTLNSFMISTGSSACPGEKISFWYADEISPFSVDWDFGDGSFKDFTNTQNYPDHIYYESGSYDVTLTIEHICGQDTLVQTIDIDSAAVPNVDAYIKNGSDFCPNDPVEFDVSGDFQSFLWNFGDGQTSTERTPTHFYDTQDPVVYNVTLTASNACGVSNTDTVIVNFIDTQPADAMFDYYTPDGGSIACPGTPVQFNSHGSGFFEWDFGDGGFSNDPDPVNYFAQEGIYHITLQVTNGCGQTATHQDSIEILTNPDQNPSVYFYFDMDQYEGDQYSGDTLYVCPGELVSFVNQSSSQDGSALNYDWNFGDGASSAARNPSHVYNTGGIYIVSLTGMNPCGGISIWNQYVNVSSGLLPNSLLGVVPETICDGETVYFYDDNGIEGTKSYNITFGDGASVSNLTDYTDTILQTLASHIYTGTPGTTFDYQFEAVNQCGNAVQKSGVITITDDPANPPFYYVTNSTSMSEGLPIFEDWSQRQDPTDYEMTIHFNWPGYPGGQDQFAVYLWYGGFYPNDDTGPANGQVVFNSSTVITGDSVKVYVPVNPLETEIGFAVGWSCDGTYGEDVEPEVWEVQKTFVGASVYSLPIIPGGSTNMLSIGNPINLDQFGQWDGLCNDERPAEEYYYEINPTTFIQLEFYESDGDVYDLYVTRDMEGQDYITQIAYGYYTQISTDTIELDEYMNCFNLSRYIISLAGDQLTFTSIDDTSCIDQETYLTMKPFQKHPDSGMDGPINLAACPEDNVLFTVAGGSSWEWHFGDGTTSNQQYPIHTYATEGMYDAFVVATNSCGRTDTIHTKVEISSGALPYAYFWLHNFEYTRLETITFDTQFDELDQAGNYSYLWDFGDGNTSTLPEPTHSYDKAGDYEISLTVTNACGNQTMTQMIRVIDVILSCEAKFSVDSIVSRNAYFSDQSRGQIKSWNWNFGDGSSSTLQNPQHLYSNDGIYFVCLSVYDSLNDCSTQFCREVVIGTVNCIADFTKVVNEATNTVNFTNRSTNTDEYFWDFGDGNFSDVFDTTYQYSEPGLYTVCLYARNSSTGCYAEVCREIAVGLSDTVGCFAEFEYFVDEANNTVRFTDQSSANATNWYWTFGDGKFAEQRSPSHIYPAPGSYNVCLIVFDAETGCVAEKCVELIVGADTCRVTADFVHFIDIPTNTVTFNNRSTGTVTDWFWDFGDGTTSSTMNPVHQYTEAGFYLITLSVWDESTGCSDHIARFIQIGAVDCRSGFDFQVDAANLTVTFENSSAGDINEYFWYFDDGDYSDEKDPVHVFDRGGLYYVSLTVLKTNVSGDIICMDFYEEAIQVGEVSCAAKFGYFIDSTSNVGYFTPEALGTATDYLWVFGDGSIYTRQQVTHLFEYPGYHLVGLNTYNAENNCMAYHEEIILIGAEGIDCQAGFIYRSDPATGDVQFKDESRGDITSWLWNFGDGNTSMVENPVKNYPERGYYLVCLTVVNSNGTPNTFCDWVQVASDDADRCFARFNFSVDSTTRKVSFVEESHGDPDKWFWNFGDNTGSADQHPTHTYASAGYYLVKLEATNTTTGCVSTTYELVNVASGNQGLRAGFDYKADSVNTKADSYPVDFVGVSVGEGGKLQWLFGDGASDTTTLNPHHDYGAPGEYPVCLKVSNPVSGDENLFCQTVQTASATGLAPVTGPGSRIANYPNPTTGMTHILYKLATATFVDLALYDNTGRMVEMLIKNDQLAGEYRLEYDASALDSGIYTLRLATREGVFIARMVVQ